MSMLGITVTKQTVFRDSVQEFHNTYHYGSLEAAQIDEAGALVLIDELVGLERTFHATPVTFVRARCWSAGRSRALNVMVAEKSLSGTGTMSASSGFDKERAYLIQWAAGKDVRGNPVTLKKWYHSCGFFGAHTLGSGVLDQSIGFTTADRTAIANKADGVTRLGQAEQWGMVAASGRERDGGPPTAHKYLEHHQLGDQWR
jgi:hypothetical protein